MSGVEPEISFCSAFNFCVLIRRKVIQLSSLLRIKHCIAEIDKRMSLKGLFHLVEILKHRRRKDDQVHSATPVTVVASSLPQIPSRRVLHVQPRQWTQVRTLGILEIIEIYATLGKTQMYGFWESDKDLWKRVKSRARGVSAKLYLSALLPPPSTVTATLPKHRRLSSQTIHWCVQKPHQYYEIFSFEFPNERPPNIQEGMPPVWMDATMRPYRYAYYCLYPVRLFSHIHTRGILRSTLRKRASPETLFPQGLKN
ncbi:predicted protein [Sclerotinia sclerotiorum 1980 UF-70]|uniref:Uncharacterized protein n=1 Tax=Sclerotinia sclerotiorum (strain ATCC 18683 / 1980 / Ss-1) TaxID=665079 RepID=A7EYP4_SCLS1|nr:predicted protein [Sclerotinia sclerotiorum 1980 UF-70]EDN94586.1 predicted protein [Sclerotinia sclerotiorum 1980 UF-70]